MQALTDMNSLLEDLLPLHDVDPAIQQADVR